MIRTIMNDLIFRGSVNYPNYHLSFDLKLSSNGTTALFGPSGAGKSTLLKAIAGLVKPEQGYISVKNEIWQNDDNAIFVPTYRREIGVVFQEPRLFPHLNVTDNLRFGLKRVHTKEQKISLDHVIDLLGISPVLNRFPQTLSGGEKQRVSIARALATNPQILLMDEPLSALDLARKQEIIPYLRRINDHLDIPIIYVSHSIEEVSILADHLVLLEPGHIIASGKTEEMLTRLDLPLAHLDSAVAIIEGTITEIDNKYHICTFTFNGGVLYLTQKNFYIGEKIRVRIHAQDVSLALQHNTQSSIVNIIKATVVNVHDNGAGEVMVELDANGNHFLSRITSKSASLLGINPGKFVFGQIKGISIIL